MWLFVVVGFVVFFGFMVFRMSMRHLLVADTMFPGPLALPLIGNSLQILKYRYDLVTYVENLTLYYRRSYRVWILNTLHIILIDPEDVQKVFGSSTHTEKSFHYNFLLDWVGRGLLTSSGDKWKKDRKMITPAFHYNILETFLDIFHRNGMILCEVLESKVGSGNFDVTPLIKLNALDNICEAAMGTQINAQLNPKSDYVISIKVAFGCSMCEIVLSRALSPWLWPKFFFNMSQRGARQRKALRIIHGLSNEVIAERIDEFKKKGREPDASDETQTKKKKVFLDIVIENSEADGLAIQNIREQVDTFMFEGHDTITSALSFALYNLAENPVFQQKAYEEQLTIFKDRNAKPTLQDFQNMRYLEMVIKESMRLHPSVPIIGRAIKEDIVLDERAILPKGSEVIVIPPIMHRIPWIWNNAKKFNPENFTPEASAKRHPYQYIPFSAGPRNCIGLRFAMLEMKSTLSYILRRFKIMPSKPAVPLKLNIEIILVSDTGINIQLERR